MEATISNSGRNNLSQNIKEERNPNTMQEVNPSNSIDSKVMKYAYDFFIFIPLIIWNTARLTYNVIVHLTDAVLTTAFHAAIGVAIVVGAVAFTALGVVLGGSLLCAKLTYNALRLAVLIALAPIWIGKKTYEDLVSNTSNNIFNLERVDFSKENYLWTIWSGSDDTESLEIDNENSESSIVVNEGTDQTDPVSTKLKVSKIALPAILVPLVVWNTSKFALNAIWHVTDAALTTALIVGGLAGGIPKTAFVVGGLLIIDAAILAAKLTYNTLRVSALVIGSPVLIVMETYSNTKNPESRFTMGRLDFTVENKLWTYIDGYKSAKNFASAVFSQYSKTSD